MFKRFRNMQPVSPDKKRKLWDELLKSEAMKVPAIGFAVMFSVSVMLTIDAVPHNQLVSIDAGALGFWFQREAKCSTARPYS
jgi:hypothetical protein